MGVSVEGRRAEGVKGEKEGDKGWEGIGVKGTGDGLQEERKNKTRRQRWIGWGVDGRNPLGFGFARNDIISLYTPTSQCLADFIQDGRI